MSSNIDVIAGQITNKLIGLPQRVRAVETKWGVCLKLDFHINCQWFLEGRHVITQLNTLLGHGTIISSDKPQIRLIVLTFVWAVEI